MLVGLETDHFLMYLNNAPLDIYCGANARMQWLVDKRKGPHAGPSPCLLVTPFPVDTFACHTVRITLSCSTFHMPSKLICLRSGLVLMLPSSEA